MADLLDQLDLKTKDSPAQKLSDVRGLCGRLHEREAESRGLFAQRRDIPVSGPPLICYGAAELVRSPMDEKVIDDTGDLVGRGHHGRFGAYTSPHALIKRS
jgi:hypothetical protein